MTKKLIAVFVASLFTSAAYAVDEQAEPHDTIATAQPLEITSTGSATVFGVLGARLKTEAARPDVDFYSFQGTEGDVVKLNIDGAAKPTTNPERSLDSYIALFGPCPTATAPKCIFNDDASRDAGSLTTTNMDSRIDNPGYRLPRSGVYTVGVTSFRRPFTNSGGVSTTSLTTTSNGSYTLIISGVTPPTLHINIEVKPGTGDSAPINPKAKGVIPVALLSSAEFNAMTVDYSSITFGAEGGEASLERCAREGHDVDGDGRPDLICHFDAQTAGFEPGDSLAVVRGRLTSQAGGRLFQGVGAIHTVGGGKKSE
jgi:hypothetical protein